MRIMVCDDNVNHLNIASKVAQSVIGEEGIVEKFSEPLDMLYSIFEEGHIPDLLIIDYMMPSLDGLQTLRILRNKGINAKALIISGYLNDIVEKMIPTNNVQVVMSKPYSLVDLAERIEEALSSPVMKKEDSRERNF